VRILRLVTQHGALDLRLVDDRTGREVPDVRRIEFAPLEMHDRRLFATIIIHERDAAGAYRYDVEEPIVYREFVELRVGSIWAI
jgi:hypothetical protein